MPSLLWSPACGAIQSCDRLESSSDGPTARSSLLAAVALSACGAARTTAAPRPRRRSPPPRSPPTSRRRRARRSTQLTTRPARGRDPQRLERQRRRSPARTTASASRSSTAPTSRSTSPQVAVYTAKPDGTELRGPFVARKESLDVADALSQRADRRPTSPAATRSTSPTPTSPRAGAHVAIGLVRLDGRLVVADAPIGAAGRREERPAGRRRPRDPVHTQTAADVGGDLTKLSTRVPPPPRDARRRTSPTSLGKKPVVLLFATPALCQSRTCGPVVDIAEQVRAQNGKGVTFIQQEIYQDNDPGKPLPPAGRRVAAADRAVGVRHRPPRQGRRPLRGRLLGGRARARRRARHDSRARVARARATLPAGAGSSVVRAADS